MAMRVVVQDAAAAAALAERLSVGFGADRVSLKRVEVERASDRSVLRVLEAVEGWLDQAGVGFAELWLGKRSCTVACWAPSRVNE
jgi:hypothetical protein